jgi:hypothetical protein
LAVTTQRLGYWLLLLGFVFVPWNAVQVQGLPLSDLLLLPASGVLILDAVASRAAPLLPAPLKIGVALFVAAGFLAALDPPGSTYLSGRVQTISVQQIALGASARSSSDLLELAKFLVAVLVLPLAASLAVRGAPQRAIRLGCAWLLGIMVSAIISVTDENGITHVSSSLLGFTDVSNRQPGLSSQPNHLGVQCVIAAPLALMLLLQAGRRRWFAMGWVVAASGGIYASASRGAAVAAIVAVVLVIIGQPRVRRHGSAITAVAALAVATLSVNGVFRPLFVKLRLSGNGASTSASDAARALVRHQAILDFYHRPIFGIGFGYIDDAHAIYLQLISAAGVIGALAFVVYVGGTLKLAWTGVRIEQELVRALAICTMAWLVIGLVENEVADQYLYVPIALISALWACQQALRQDAGPGSSPAAVRPRDDRGRRQLIATT